CARFARACCTCASAADARAFVASTCCGAVCADCSSACACCSAARACISVLSAAGTPASASATCERDESAAARCASPAATAASNCCCDTSSFASRPRRRSTSRVALVAFASASRSFACAAVSRARAAATSCSAATMPLCAWATPPRAVKMLLDAVVDVIGTFVCAACAAASASASSARAPSADASDKLPQDFLGGAGAADQRAFREVVAESGVDGLLAGQRDRFLRLNDFDVARHTGGEPVARLRELLPREVARLRRGLQLQGGRLQIEERVPHLVINRGFHVFGLGAPAADVGVGFEQPPLQPSSLEDRDVDGSDDAVH